MANRHTQDIHKTFNYGILMANRHTRHTRIQIVAELPISTYAMQASISGKKAPHSISELNSTKKSIYKKAQNGDIRFIQHFIQNPEVWHLILCATYPGAEYCVIKVVLGRVSRILRRRLRATNVRTGSVCYVVRACDDIFQR